jgi:hypothetical protein
MDKSGASAPYSYVTELINRLACTIYLQVFWNKAVTKGEI